MRRTKKLRKRPGEVFVSPDGGETVYRRRFGEYDNKEKI